MKSSCGKLSRRKSPFWERLRLMKFQAPMQYKVPKREREIHKLDGNFNKASFPVVFHLLILHHLMVPACSLFEASVVLLCELLGSKSHSAIFLARETHLYQSLDHRFLFFLFMPFSFSCLSNPLYLFISQEDFVNLVAEHFLCLFLFPHSLWAEITDKSFSHS